MVLGLKTSWLCRGAGIEIQGEFKKKGHVNIMFKQYIGDKTVFLQGSMWI